MTGKEKPIPSRTAARAAPPYEDRAYFESCGEHPFLHASGRYELVNAWWLAEASLLAYAEPDFAVPRFLEAGFAEVEYFCGDSTQCYVAHDEGFVVSAFSGTDMRARDDTDGADALTDWLVNLRFDMVDSGRDGRVHKGFKQALDEVWDPPGSDKRLGAHLDRVCEGGQKKVWFTGHSLGAALATIAAGRYEHAPELYTFGSPRVGDRAFVENLDLRAYRFVNGEDVVAKVPPGPYHHVGSLKLVDHEGRIHDGETEREGASGLRERLSRVFSPVLEAVGNSKTGTWGRIRRNLSQEAVLDHSPLFYTVHVWNNYVNAGEDP